jgi:hypothetical protein
MAMPFVGSASVNVFGGQKCDAAVTVLAVVAGEETTAEVSRLIDVR